MDEVSDDELWRHLHHGRPGEDDGSPRAHRTDTDAQLQSMMRDTNDILRARILSLPHDLEAAAVLNDVPVPATDAMESQITFKALNQCIAFSCLPGPTSMCITSACVAMSLENEKF